MKGKHCLFANPALYRRASAKGNGWLKAGAALLGLLLQAPDVARADDPGATHYPDLQPYSPYDLRVEFDSGHKLLKFSVANANFGQGEVQQCFRNKISALQTMEDKDS